MGVIFQNIVLVPFLGTLLLSLILTPLSIPFIKRLGLLDDPKKRKHPGVIHKKIIPRGGGIPLFASIFLASLVFLPKTSEVSILLFASFISLVIGVLDDKFDISPYFRFGVNIFAASLVVLAGVGIDFITNPLQGGILRLDEIYLFTFLGRVITLSELAAVLWIVWLMNMLNWSKGVDGQMPGIVAISAFIIGVLSLRFPLSDPYTYIGAILSFILAGAALGFLPFNFYPAKIFPGYGSTSVYFLLAVVSILSGAKLATAILVMGIPFVDGIFTVTRRVLSGRSPFWHDRKHLHHLLLGYGFTQRKIALFYWCVSAILGLISLSLDTRGKLFAIIMLTVVIGGGLLFLHFALRNENNKNGI